LRLLGAAAPARPPLVGPLGHRRPAPPATPTLRRPSAPSATPAVRRPSTPLATLTPRRASAPLVPPAARRPSAPPAAGAPARGRPGPPALAWIGVALIACALPGGAIAWRVRRRATPLAPARASRTR
jgi:hypothetical protein